MPKHWLSPGLLATKLARGEVANREIAYFMLGNMLLATAIYYSGLALGNPPWTLLSLWEAALVAIVIVFGMIQCFEVAGGDANPRFAADFNCLTFPIFLWTTTIIWAAFWLISWVFRMWMTSFTTPDRDVADAVSYWSGKFGWLLTVAAIVGGQVAYFVWMRSMMRKIKAERHDR